MSRKKAFRLMVAGSSLGVGLIITLPSSPVSADCAFTIPYLGQVPYGVGSITAVRGDKPAGCGSVEHDVDVQDSNVFGVAYWVDGNNYSGLIAWKYKASGTKLHRHQAHGIGEPTATI